MYCFGLAMARHVFLLTCALTLLAFSLASAEVVEHSFKVKNLTIQPLCQKQVITAVTGNLPGPTIQVHEGDTHVVHVSNKSPYNLTIHCAWADGPEYVTQCPIRPGSSYTYKFNITGQEGTLWWHAHSQWLRATVYGALIIRPRVGHSYPFPKPYREFPILLVVIHESVIAGEWWNANVIDVENEGLATGGATNSSDAFTINGRPGDLYPCSSNHTYKVTVVQRKTYLLRIINPAMNNQFFFKIANHNLTIVVVDATYTTPMVTDFILIAAGQTTDVLFTANQPPASYYMAAHPYVSSQNITDNSTSTTGIIVYKNALSLTPQMSVLPAFNDTPTAYKFSTSLFALVNAPHWVPVPLKVDEHMFMTISLGLIPCERNTTCAGPLDQRLATSMNNASFQFPTKLSMLQAFFNNVDGIYTTDFPNQPPLNNHNDIKKSTKVKKLKFNSTVEMVSQNTASLGIEMHPMHLHGFNFHALAQGFGNYDPINNPKKFNLINPQARNTIGVPTRGWAVIRFQANNPGIWLMHCHMDLHLPWGLSLAFEVENGPTPSTTLPLPPPDLPQC
ncbi:Laccase-7 [Camellia lanceoleosa]|uniref:Laccase-7 n=1 Tax=Camellia lanceoleosa TaxID=1840588 RepID=A0ACC0HW03_9ERIC|nr:Laccase-7 [Camellia lanceoleosa]